MIRLSMVFLVLLLLGAAAGRYRAEVSVREARSEISVVRAAQKAEIREIQMLRAEVAYLENPDRLSTIAEMATDLSPVSSDQLLTAEDFVLAFAVRPTPRADAADDGEAPRSRARDGRVAIAKLGDAQ